MKNVKQYIYMGKITRIIMVGEKHDKSKKQERTQNANMKQQAH